MKRSKSHYRRQGFLARVMIVFQSMALLCSPLAAQDNQGSEIKPKLLYKNATLDMVLADYSRYTGRTLLMSPTIPKNITIQLQNQSELTLEEALEAIETVLSMNGIALVREGDKFLRVIKSQEARKEPMPIMEQLPDERENPLDDSGELISKMVVLSHIDLAEAQKAVKPLMHSYGQVTPFDRINAMLVTDTAANINRIQQILGYIDQPVERREVPHVVPIRYAKASDIKKKLEEIIRDSQDAQKKKQSVSAPKVAGSPGMVKTHIPGFSEDLRAPKIRSIETADVEDLAREFIEAEHGVIRGKVQIVADERTNILIIITRPENWEYFLQQIVHVLDVPTDPDVVVKIIRLEYAKADTVASTLNTLIGAKGKQPENPNVTAGAKKGGSAELREYVAKLEQDRASAGTASKVGELSAANIKILPDERTNALIIMARKADFMALEEIIKNMDIMLSQVMIEVVIVQVTLDKTVSSGVHWIQRALIINDERKNGSLKPVGAIASAGGAGGANVGGLLSATDLSTLGNWAGGEGFSTYFTHFGLNLDVIIKMLSTDSRTQILSTPVITTTDNTKATLTSNEQKYFFKGNTVDQWGNVHPQTEIRDIGLTLEVTPKINKSRNVVLEINQEVSNPAGDQIIDGQRWPTTTKRSFTASIAVNDRETIVLGGLVRTYETQTRSKVPLLGSIPLLGRLFRYQSKSDERGEVVVFITPYVLDMPKEIEKESRRRRDALNVDWKYGWSGSKLAGDYPADAEDRAPVEIDTNVMRSATAPKTTLATVEDKPEAPPKAEKQPENRDVEKSDTSINADPEVIEFIRRNEKKLDDMLEEVDRKVEEHIKKQAAASETP